MEQQSTKKLAFQYAHYNDAFREGAIKMVIEQKLPVKQVAKELGICIDTLRSWLKKSIIKMMSLKP